MSACDAAGEKGREGAGGSMRPVLMSWRLRVPNPLSLACGRAVGLQMRSQRSAHPSTSSAGPGTRSAPGPLPDLRQVPAPATLPPPSSHSHQCFCGFQLRFSTWFSTSLPASPVLPTSLLPCFRREYQNLQLLALTSILNYYFFKANTARKPLAWAFLPLF